MKTLLTFSLLLLTTTFIYSCKKDKDHSNEGTELTRYKTTINDTLLSYHIYDRDASNKIIAIRDSIRTAQYIMDVEYGSNGKVSKANFRSNNSGIQFYFEFEYNADGRIKKRQIRPGSVAIGQDYNTYTYDAAGHLLVDSQYNTVNNVTWYPASVSKFTYEGDNVTLAERYVFTSGVAALESKMKYEYDNGINPFKGMPNEYFYNESGSAIFTISILSGNNVTKSYTASGSGDFTLLQSSSYQYNSSNIAWKVHSISQAQRHLQEEYFFK